MDDPISEKISTKYCEPYFFFLNWDSLHAGLNSHYKACSYKKKKQKKIKAYNTIINT